MSTSQSGNTFNKLHVCPAWLSSMLDNKLRKIFHDPEKILSAYIQKGNTAVDIGCGPGFFTIAMANLVGETGRVIAVDLQEKMLARLRARAVDNGVIDRIAFHQCGPDDIGLNEKADFVLAFWMVHEVPDSERLFKQIRDILKPGGIFLFVEPKMHVSASRFNRDVEKASAIGLKPSGEVTISLSRAMLFKNT